MRNLVYSLMGAVALATTAPGIGVGQSAPMAPTPPPAKSGDVESVDDSKRTLQDEKPFSRGINSIQILTDGIRHYIVSIFWDSEIAASPIPSKYLNRAP